MDSIDYRGKAVVFLADGMADEPLAELGGKTPLEAVDTPWMDRIAERGASGTFLSLPDGYSLAQFYPGRGPIEAAAQGIELGPDDIAWRCNLVNVKDGILKDYSSGHISNEISEPLMKALQERFGSADVTFYPGVSYRNLLVLHGKKFSANIDYHKPDSSQDEPVAELGLTALDDTPEAAYTVKFLTELQQALAEIEADDQVKVVIVTGEGKAFVADEDSSRLISHLMADGYRVAFRLMRFCGMRIAECAGMDVVRVPGATGFIDTNYEGKAQAALEALKNHDLVYLHLEAIDECSHLGDLKLKMQAISEFENRIVAPVMKALEGKGVTFAVEHFVVIVPAEHGRVNESIDGTAVFLRRTTSAACPVNDAADA